MNRDELLALYDKELRIEIKIPGVQKEAFANLVRSVQPAPGMNYIAYSRLNGTVRSAGTTPRTAAA